MPHPIYTSACCCYSLSLLNGTCYYSLPITHSSQLTHPLTLIHIPSPFTFFLHQCSMFSSLAILFSMYPFYAFVCLPVRCPCPFNNYPFCSLLFCSACLCPSHPYTVVLWPLCLCIRAPWPQLNVVLVSRVRIWQKLDRDGTDMAYFSSISILFVLFYWSCAFVPVQK